MLTKKSVTILIIVAIVLAGVAIALQLSDTEEVSTTTPTTGNSIKGSSVGIIILPSSIEDKLASGEQS
jgi:hypothetical protein